MLFNSWSYVLLVCALVPVYYLVRATTAQVALLIAGSFVFYAYGQPYLLALLVFSASLNGVSSYFVERSSSRQQKLLWAICGVGLNLAVLAFFKYAGFFAESIQSLTGNGVQPGHWLVTLPLPVGISFYTFQGISLVLDILRYDSVKSQAVFGIQKHGGFSQHFFKTIFFVCFFPQLVAGPIVKAHEFFPQIKRKYFREVNWDPAFRALILGYFLKMGVADNLNSQTFWIAYPYFLKFSSIDLLALLFGFSMQIFADFAGYSLIAIGTARLFGYELRVNFNFPYIARSFSDFWRRWHISLSSWLRDYLYIPLGGNQKGHMRTYVNLFIVMFLGGLWHGAAWSYAVWGIWHGLALALERPWRRLGQPLAKSRLWAPVGMGFVFLYVTFSWLLFQLPNFGEAVRYLQAIAQNNAIHIRLDRVLVILIYSVPVILYHLRGWGREHGFLLGKYSYNIAYGGMLFWVLFNSGSSEAFIYFQF